MGSDVCGFISTALWRGTTRNSVIERGARRVRQFVVDTERPNRSSVIDAYHGHAGNALCPASPGLHAPIGLGRHDRARDIATDDS